MKFPVWLRLSQAGQEIEQGNFRPAHSSDRIKIDDPHFRFKN